jgi:hypothetical protein
MPPTAPLVIESAAGAGKTRFVHRLAALSDPKLVYFDCATMTNMTPIISQDATRSGARHSEIIEGLASRSAHPIVTWTHGQTVILAPTRCHTPSLKGVPSKPIT